MSHWTTSGGARLKAKQKRSFAKRAMQRARLFAPEKLIMRGESSNIQVVPPERERKNQKYEGKSVYSIYDCRRTLQNRNTIDNSVGTNCDVRYCIPIQLQNRDTRMGILFDVVLLSISLEQTFYQLRLLRLAPVSEPSIRNRTPNTREDLLEKIVPTRNIMSMNQMQRD